MRPVIELTDFSKEYGGTYVVENLTFAVEEGSIVGLLGPNGAGKSTTMRALAGLTRPTSGSAKILGHRFDSYESPASVAGFHLDTFGFETGISARRHLEICRLAAGVGRHRVGTVLEEVGLAAHARKRVKTFSTGMTQRLGLATALIAEPKVLVLDEPSNGLDPDGIRWLRRFLADFARGGGTVLVSSHLLAELEQIVDTVVVIDRRLLYAGPVGGILGGERSLEDGYFDLLDRGKENADA